MEHTTRVRKSDVRKEASRSRAWSASRQIHTATSSGRPRARGVRRATRDRRSPRVSGTKSLRLCKGNPFGPNTKNRVDNPPATRWPRRHQISPAASAPPTSLLSLSIPLLSSIPHILFHPSTTFLFLIPLAEHRYLFILVIRFPSFLF